MKPRPKTPVEPENSAPPGNLEAETEPSHRLWPLIERALTQFDEETLQAAWALNRNLSTTLQEETASLLAGCRNNGSRADDSAIRVKLGSLQQLQLISKYLFGFMREVREKIDRDIIFSPRAFGQLIGLWQTTSELFQQTRGFLESNGKIDEVLISRRCAEITDLIMEYDLEHEARLIRGVCPQNASFIFLNMLDSIRGIIRCLDSIASLH